MTAVAGRTVRVVVVESPPVNEAEVVTGAWSVRYPLHARALLRHAEWAADDAAVGDLEGASEALLDFEAIAGELHDDADAAARLAGGRRP